MDVVTQEGQRTQILPELAVVHHLTGFWEPSRLKSATLDLSLAPNSVFSTLWFGKSDVWLKIKDTKCINDFCNLRAVDMNLTHEILRKRKM